MPGGERARVCRLYGYVCGSLGPSNKCAHWCVRACVRTLHAITASRTSGVRRRGRLYERQSDPGNLMRNWTAVDTRLKRAMLLCTLALIAERASIRVLGNNITKYSHIYIVDLLSVCSHIVLHYSLLIIYLSRQVLNCLIFVWYINLSPPFNKKITYAEIFWLSDDRR